MSRQTRTGCIFSPYDAIVCNDQVVEQSLSHALCRLEAEYDRDACDAMDVEEDDAHSVAQATLGDGMLGEILDADSCNQTPVAASSKAEKDKKRRQKKRQERKKDKFWSKGHPPTQEMLRIVDQMEAIDARVQQGSVENLPSASCGYQAIRDGPERSRRVRSLDEALLDGYKVIKWDGRLTKVITTETKRVVIGVCVGHAQDEDWTTVGQDAYSAISKAAADIADLDAPRTPNPRGNFATLLSGIIHGHGSQEAHQVKTGRYADVIQGLKENASIKRLAGFASASFQMFAPNVFSYYLDRMKSLNTHRPLLQRPFARSVFACAGFNIGHRVAAFMHRDCMNCPFGWCAIHALGDFDHELGGHMLLEDLKIAIEFPPNSLMLIPSAIIKHGNAAVAEGGVRASFTQFTPGNLFRFIDCGFQTESSLQIQDKDRYRHMMELKKSRWIEGVKLWSTVEELQAIAKDVAQSSF
ncbi:hypothetical protein CVT24_011891 [Panaeolus cyanescens]|uniref:Uncharacterized protein n=1 Tax=Panaeolus cyanescens TaxID=181874 RepID=A0A409YP85_9AGAR|nr:hypothetical protein CVT24_011891 [Panaeolus cyanescens]